MHVAELYREHEIELWTSTRVPGIQSGVQELLLEGDRRQREIERANRRLGRELARGIGREL